MAPWGASKGTWSREIPRVLQIAPGVFRTEGNPTGETRADDLKPFPKSSRPTGVAHVAGAATFSRAAEQFQDKSTNMG